MKKLLKIVLDLFDDTGLSGQVINTTAGYTNAGTQDVTAFNSDYTLAPTLKIFVDTQLLENTREKRYFAQFGKKQPLPKNKGKTEEWRKFKTLPPAMKALVEGVNPKGRKLGETSITKAITQHGDYIEKSDQLDTHAYDDVTKAAVEELGSAAAQTQDLLIRNELLTGTNVMLADTVAANGTATANTARWKMSGKAYLTPDMVAKAAVNLEAANVPKLEGRYFVALIHTYCKYDMRSSEYWTSVHQYAAVEEIFNGEIGEMHGVRFIETTNAKVWAPKTLFDDSQRYLTVAAYSGSATGAATAGTATAYRVTVSETLTEAMGKALVGRSMLLERGGEDKELMIVSGTDYSNKYLYLATAPTLTPQAASGSGSSAVEADLLNPGEGGAEIHTDGKQNAVFACTFFGKDAFGIVDPDGAGLEMIYHDRRIAGGPLELKSTIGYKFETATAILYPERLLRLEVLSAYSGTAQDVLDSYEDGYDNQY